VAFWSFFFFFQAEDGIRDLYVTGVQTCALPISMMRSAASGVDLVVKAFLAARDRLPDAALLIIGPAKHWQALLDANRSNGVIARSEERRVGKECRFRWWTE